MLTHANLSAACQQYVESTRGDPPVLEAGRERFLAVLPPFHIYALTVNMLFGICIGAELVLHARFDPKAALEDIAGKRITVFCGVPTMFTALLDHPQTPGHDLRSLKYCGSGGAPLPVEVGQRYAEITGVQAVRRLGHDRDLAHRHLHACAYRRQGGLVRHPVAPHRDQAAVPGGPDEVRAARPKGEMCIKGPNVMKGYWNKPEATAEVTTFDGFMRTGDVATIDEDGYVFIVDRCKDMLLCSGFNVYPRVLEEAIYRYPAVHEVCVVGIPDPYARPVAEGLRDAQGRRRAVHARAVSSLPEGQARQARDDPGAGDPRSAAEDGGRQAVEERPRRRGKRAQAGSAGRLKSVITHYHN